MAINKQAARAYIREEKKKLSNESVRQRSAKIIDNLKRLEEFKQADTILVYVNYNQEVETIPLIEHCFNIGKTVLVPKVCGDVMHFYKIHSLSELKAGCMGILEPITEELQDLDTGFMVMPGLAFDRKCGRIGYGGGYYDKYLMKHKNIFTAAVAFDFQIVEQLELEEFDIRPDVIVTETKIINKFAD